MKIVKLSFVLISALSTLYAQRIGDIANVIGVRDNQLIGYGLVVGLNGTVMARLHSLLCVHFRIFYKQ